MPAGDWSRYDNFSQFGWPRDTGELTGRGVLVIGMILSGRTQHPLICCFVVRSRREGPGKVKSLMLSTVQVRVYLDSLVSAVQFSPVQSSTVHYVFGAFELTTKEEG
jgi:hypothetical protein